MGTSCLGKLRKVVPITWPQDGGGGGGGGGLGALQEVGKAFSLARLMGLGKQGQGCGDVMLPSFSSSSAAALLFVTEFC